MMADKYIDIEFLEGDGIALTVGRKPKWAIVNLTKKDVSRIVDAIRCVHNITINEDGSVIEEPAP